VQKFLFYVAFIYGVVFWDVTPCSLADQYCRFRGSCFVYQGRAQKRRKERNGKRKERTESCPEDGSGCILRDVGEFLPDHMASHLRRQQHAAYG
jgi:hypothetical protein